jgi:hypothetical protein
VLEAERSGRQFSLNDEKLLDISDSMLRCPSKSWRKWSQEEGIGLETAHKAVGKQLKLFIYKVTSVQDLKPAEHENEYIHKKHLTSRPAGSVWE